MKRKLYSELRTLYETSGETAGHLMAFCYWKNRLYIDVWHGLTDGGGVAPMLKTLLYYYCTLYYGVALSRCLTATVSYVGKASLGEAERYIQEYEALPSTALPSTHVSLTVEMSAMNGYFFLNFIQYFREEDYFMAFIRELRKNDIDYDVLNVTEARYPRAELL